MASLKYWDGVDWVTATGDCVKTVGDTMTGDLTVQDSVNSTNIPRAWVSMGVDMNDGYGSPAKILDSFGVSSVQFNAVNTRNQISFVQKFQDLNYCCIGTPRQATNSELGIICLFTQSGFALNYVLYYALAQVNGTIENDIKPLGISATFYSSKPMVDQ